MLAWIVARKDRAMGQKFVCPQQGKWATRYL